MAQASHLKLDEQSLITSQLVKKHTTTSDVADSTELKEKVAQLALVLDLARQGFESGTPAADIVDRLAARLHDRNGSKNGNEKPTPIFVSNVDESCLTMTM